MSRWATARRLGRAARLHLRLKFASFFTSTPRSPVIDITADELKTRLAANQPPFIVDVREPWEHAESQLPTATLNIPLGELPTRLDELADHRESELVVHCRSGARSATAKKFLEQQGFQGVRNLLGGILGY